MTKSKSKVYKGNEIIALALEDNKLKYISSSGESKTLGDAALLNMAYEAVKDYRLSDSNFIKRLTQQDPLIMVIDELCGFLKERYPDVNENELRRIFQDLNYFTKGSGSSFSAWYPLVQRLNAIVPKRLEEDSQLATLQLDHVLPRNVIPQAKNVTEWLSLINLCKEAAKKPHSKIALWFNVSERYIRVQIDPNFNYCLYASDHGHINEAKCRIPQQVKNVLDMPFMKLFHNVNWFSTRTQIVNSDEQCQYRFLYNKEIVNFVMKDYLDILGKYDENSVRDAYVLLMQSLRDEKIRESSYSYDDNTLVHLLENSLLRDSPSVFPQKTIKTTDRAKRAIDILHYFFETTQNQAIDRANDLCGKSIFWTQVCNVTNSKIGEQFRQRRLILDLSQCIDNGDSSVMLRDSSAYGPDSNGQSYTKFLENLKETKEDDKNIAREIRSILRGKESSIDCLPNLVTALFLSESVRWDLSFCTSLMLLDLIETGKSPYNWENCLTQKGKGGHPMCHKKSVTQANTLHRILDSVANPKFFETQVSSKTVVILADWLCERFKSRDKVLCIKKPKELIQIMILERLETLDCLLK